MRRSVSIAITVGLSLLSGTAVQASETKTYTYDAKGRMTAAAVASGPANGTATSYQFDAADNRVNVSTTGATLRIVVVPLAGYTIIPIH